jgi:hypothetical protein
LYVKFEIAQTVGIVLEQIRSAWIRVGIRCCAMVGGGVVKSSSRRYVNLGHPSNIVAKSDAETFVDHNVRLSRLASAGTATGADNPVVLNDTKRGASPDRKSSRQLKIRTLVPW